MTAIIGAGVAGMAAFQSLREAGVDAVLIEARDRVGGRVHTLDLAGWPVPVELGAEFIHGNPPELARFADTDSEPPADIGDNRALARLDKVSPSDPDRTFSDFLAQQSDLGADERAGAIHFIEGFEAADPERISVQSLHRERAAADETAAPWRPRQGYAAVLDSLRTEGPILTNTVVELIRWRPGAVVIHALGPLGTTEIAAERAIVTLPLSLLQTQSPRFEPPLSAKASALSHLVMGAALRLTFRLSHRLWRDQDAGFLFGDVRQPGHFGVWWTAPDGATQITGWMGGPQVKPGMADTQRGIADLARILGCAEGAIESAFIASHSHDWQADPFSRGAYSYAAVGGIEAARGLATPLAGTLFFAGEATMDDGSHATTHGAIRSGRRAAQEVLSALRRKV
ncbi:MAG TPA: NAD(P)/FAD-dependent oxidoreductase [Terriglobales bacterium]|nr:NAD(P)/FAD-dependent oxidoreductase [Terriglobales bacterium]